MLRPGVDLQLTELRARETVARQQLTKLKVYAGPEHPHTSQNPRPLNLEQ